MIRFIDRSRAVTADKYNTITDFPEQHLGFVVDKAAMGQVFSEYFGFPCQSSFNQFLHHNHPGLAQ
jgi:hypothetical protein